MAPAPMAIDAVIDAIRALQGPTTCVTQVMPRLSAHLASVQKTLDAMIVDEQTARAADAVRSSSARLERMLRLLERIETGKRRTGGYDAATLRTSLVVQLRAHAELEQHVRRRAPEAVTSEPGDAPAGSYRHPPSATVASTGSTRSRSRWRRRVAHALRTVAGQAHGRS